MHWCRVAGVLVTISLLAPVARRKTPPETASCRDQWCELRLCTCKQINLSATRAANRVAAQGRVEIDFNNYILTADQVTYDQGANTLVAEHPEGWRAPAIDELEVDQ